MNKPCLEIICGSMFSGKTEELMRRLKRAEFAKQKVLTIKHHIDARKSLTSIVSHNGRSRQAHPLKNTHDCIARLLLLADETVDVVGIDEIQFFPEALLPTIMTLIDQGKRIILAGLDLDFRAEPFGIMPTLLALAEKVTKLHAICMKCGDEASFSQRLIDGNPAKYNDPLIKVGAEECYEARCRKCFVIDRPLNYYVSMPPKTDAPAPEESHG